jgi:hypothetical protein
MTENPYAGQGPVLLDIGGRIGALVVDMPAALAGVEIEIRPAGYRADQLRHVAVIPRHVGDRLGHAAVFADLAAGDYELYVRPTSPVRLRIAVTGGQVTLAAWPPDDEHDAV